ncbi:MAG: hypothetical protein KDD37_03940 [Bdellovibrionales bacterium]|nr:hypothetical protein [Bdellovibrionales bacterium]
MSTTDIVKKFEVAGFTRTQAELQVKTMVDMKQGLMTQKDGELLNGNVNLLNIKMDLVEKSLNARMDGLDIKIDLVEKSLNAKIDLVPLKTTIYIAGLLATIWVLTNYEPIFRKWLSTSHY